MLEALDCLMKNEDGSSDVSMYNVLLKTEQTGYIVGAIHCVSCSGEEHTDLYFQNGDTCTLRGTKSGVENEHSMALKAILQMIPFIFPIFEGDFVANFGGKEVADRLEKQDLTSANYIIRPDYFSIPDELESAANRIQNSPGNQSMNEFIAEHSDKEKIEIHELEYKDGKHSFN